MPVPKKKNRHEPVRRCAACRRTAPKSSLIRFTRLPHTLQVQTDPTQQLPGRGAYLCPRPECVRLALKRKSLDRVLKVQVPDALLQQLLTQLTQASGDLPG